MTLEEKLQPIAEKITEELAELSHWESILVLEMVKEVLQVSNLIRSLKK